LQGIVSICILLADPTTQNNGILTIDSRLIQLNRANQSNVWDSFDTDNASILSKMTVR